MGFMDSYKHLEKLCGEIMNDNRCVSAYIDEMLNTPRGRYYVRTWNEDLKMLKHYRWVRNQISHEPGCTEENMCEFKDELWIEDFYSRIMNQTDPLALYGKAIRQSTADKSTATRKQSIPTHTQPNFILKPDPYAQPKPYIQPNPYTKKKRKKSEGQKVSNCLGAFFIALSLVFLLPVFAIVYGIVSTIFY